MPAVEDRMRSLPSSVAGSGAGSKKDMMVVSLFISGDGGVVDCSRQGQLLTLIPSRSGDRAPVAAPQSKLKAS
jgi:hypothetical protein